MAKFQDAIFSIKRSEECWKFLCSEYMINDLVTCCCCTRLLNSLSHNILFTYEAWVCLNHHLSPTLDFHKSDASFRYIKFLIYIVVSYRSPSSPCYPLQDSNTYTLPFQELALTNWVITICYFFNHNPRIS